MSAIETRAPLRIEPVEGDPTVRRLVRADVAIGDPDVGFVLTEYAGLFRAAPNLHDAARTALRAMEAMYPIAIPAELAHAYNRLYDAVKDADKGEMRV